MAGNCGELPIVQALFGSPLLIAITVSKRDGCTLPGAWFQRLFMQDLRYAIES
jgi:hypothetical protein